MPVAPLAVADNVSATKFMLFYKVNGTGIILMCPCIVFVTFSSAFYAQGSYAHCLFPSGWWNLKDLFAFIVTRSSSDMCQVILVAISLAKASDFILIPALIATLSISNNSISICLDAVQQYYPLRLPPGWRAPLATGIQPFGHWSPSESPLNRHRALWVPMVHTVGQWDSASWHRLTVGDTGMDNLCATG